MTKVWLPTEPKSGAASLEFTYNLGSYPANAKSRTLYQKASGTYLESWGYVDGFGRTIQRQQLKLWSSNRRVTSQQYNQRGELLYSSATYEVSGLPGSGYVPPTWTSLNHYQEFTYDELGRARLTKTKSGSSLLWETETTYAGWQQSQYDANDHRTDYLNDAFGNLVQVTEHNGGSQYTTNYSYDITGNLTSVTDHLSNSTSMSYDMLGRKTSMTDPDMGSWQYQYDGAGNLTAQQDGRNLWMHMAYDDLNRLIRKRKDSTTGPKIAEYVYDTVQKGQLYATKAYDAAGSTITVENQVTALDARYRPTERKSIVAGTGGGTFRMAYAYDEANHLTYLTYPGNNANGLGEQVRNIYNHIGGLDQVISQADNTHYVSSTVYRVEGMVSYQRLDQGNNGAYLGYGFDSNTLRPTYIYDYNATSDQYLTYGYDSAGNITQLTDYRNSSQVQTFTYDALDRLATASTNGVGVGQYSHTYAYDAIGNITSYNGNTYTYGSKPHAVTAAHGNSYGYDGNGNQTTRTIGGTTYTLTYDYENRLVSVSGGSVSASFVYDANGNRVKGTVNGTTTVYVDGIYEYQNGASTRYYSGAKGTVAMQRSGCASDNGVFYMLRDHLSSTSVIVNKDGSVAKKQYYFPFGGNRDSSAFSSLTTKRFTGQYHEDALPGGEGLSYYGARWYDAQLGRFTSADTIVPSPANPQDFNRYAYVRNNPLRYTDPTGHRIFEHTPDDPISSGGSGGGSSVPLYNPPPAAPVSTSTSNAGWNPWLGHGTQYAVQGIAIGAASYLAAKYSNQINGWIWNRVPTAVGPHVGVEFGSGMLMEANLSFQAVILVNWWSGEVSLFLVQSAEQYAGTPRGGSASGYLGSTTVYGLSENSAYPGASIHYGLGAQVDAVETLGVNITGAYAIEHDDANKDGQFQLLFTNDGMSETFAANRPIFDFSTGQKICSN